MTEGKKSFFSFRVVFFWGGEGGDRGGEKGKKRCRFFCTLGWWGAAGAGAVAEALL